MPRSSAEQGEEAQSLKENGKSQESISTWSYRVVVVLKPHGMGSAGLEGTQPAPSRQRNTGHISNASECSMRLWGKVPLQQDGVSLTGVIQDGASELPGCSSCLNEPGGELLLPEP